MANINPYLLTAPKATKITGSAGATSPPPIDYDAPLTPEELAELEGATAGQGIRGAIETLPGRRYREEEIRRRRASGALGTFYDESTKLAEELGQGGYNPERYTEYERSINEPVERDFFDQAQSASAYLARQGLGSSGINIVSHQGLAANRNSIENQGRRLAIDMARSAKRQETLDEFQTRLSALGPVLQKYGVDINAMLAMRQMRLQKEMADEQSRASMLGALGTGAGYLGGGPLGAAMFNYYTGKAGS